MSRFRGQVQGFAVGAAVVAALMFGLPALTGLNSPSEDMDELAAQFDVEIVWSNVNPCTPSGPAHGCYLNATPSLIYVSPDMPAEFLRYTVLHEIGHVVQQRLWLPPSECAADRFAQSLGTIKGAYCPYRPE